MITDEIEAKSDYKKVSPQRQKSLVHPTAIIDPAACLDSSVEVGPYSIIGPNVHIGAGTVIGPHVVLKGHLVLGERNRIFQFASVGEDCQDKKYNGEPTSLVIGDDNVVRESATLQRGTAQEQGLTQIGHRNLFMAYTHVGHDSIVGSDCVFANSATIAGHVTIGDGVILGGFTGVHQFCSIGDFAMSGMCSAVNMDIPAYVRAQGNMANVQGLNVEGMRRRGMSKLSIQTISKAYKLVYRENLKLDEAMAQVDILLQGLSDPQEQQDLGRFIQSIRQSKRGLLR